MKMSESRTKSLEAFRPLLVAKALHGQTFLVLLKMEKIRNLVLFGLGFLRLMIIKLVVVFGDFHRLKILLL